MAGHNLASDFWENQARHPERTALIVNGESYSYRDLARRASLIAGWIAANSLSRHPRVGVLATRTLEAYIGFLAVLLANGTFVPLNPRFPPRHLRTILRTTRVNLLLVDGQREKLLTSELVGDAKLRILSALRPATEKQEPVIEGEDRIAPCRPLEEPARAAPGDMAYILFTSGTTGVPKGIIGCIGNIAAYHRAVRERYGFTPEDRFAQNMEIDFDPFTFELLAAWGAGAAVHVPTATEAIAPLHFIKAHGITVWYGGPTIVTALERMQLLKPGVFPTLRLSMFIGEPLTIAAAEAWRRAAPNSVVENEYAPTEVHGVCLCHRLDSPPGDCAPQRNLVPLGTPLPGMRTAITDPGGHFLPPGESGEIAIAGPQVTKGYWRNTDLTRRRFRALDHPRHGQGLWYLSGDRGVEDSAGIFHFLGRLDNQVKIFGHRVELEEVEFHLRNLGGAGCEAAAVAWPLVEGLAHGLVGFLTAGDIDPDRIKVKMRSLVPSYMVPKALYMLDAMPRNIHGKIDRQSLLARLGQGL